MKQFDIYYISRALLIGCSFLTMAAYASSSHHVSNPFPNQTSAAIELLTYFRSKMNACLLRADVQSGKTGTYQFLIRQMFAEGMIDRAYILCGSHETELREQCNTDVKKWNLEYENRIQVIFRQDFHKYNMVKQRKLIIVDETHLVCKKDQTLAAFLQRHGLTLGGSTEQMRKDDTYILSVDATPFAELSAMIHKESASKGYVVLDNGDGYFGPQHYHAAGLIHETFDVNAHRSDFVDLIKQFPRKYFLIRMDRCNKQFQIIMDAAQDNADIVYFTSDKCNRQILLTDLKHAPSKTTIVVIIGKLRCGKRVPKQHIAVVWEASAKADTDVILQGLLGRMSGYLAIDPPDKDEEYEYKVPDVKSLIFLPKKCLSAPRDTAVVHPITKQPLSDLERAFHPETIPRYASHVVPGMVQRVGHAVDDSVRYPCVPISFQLSPEYMAQLEDPIFHEHTLRDIPKKKLSIMCLTMLTENDTVDKRFFNEYITESQRIEIAHKIQIQLASTDPCSIRRFRNESSLGQHESCIKAITTNTSSNEHIANCPFLTFCITFSDCKHPNAIPGRVFAIVYTEAVGIFERIHLESRIPRQDGKTHFTLSPAMRESPAGFVIGFSPAIIDNASLFEKEFDTFIRWSKSGIGRFSTKIVSLHGESIQFISSIYGRECYIFKKILLRLQRKHSVTITFKLTHKSPNTLPFKPRMSGHIYKDFYHNIEWIEWQ